MIRNVLMAMAIVLTATQTFAQSSSQEITTKNSWLKAGLAASVPVGKLSDYSSFAAGVDVSGQMMATKNLGLGIASGYTHFFAKDGLKDFGTIPVGLLVRYYPQPKGFFAGADVGYSFLTNSDVTGGLYIKPQVGYHNYNWNFYGFYNQVFVEKNYVDVQNVGIAATYNLRFK